MRLYQQFRASIAAPALAATAALTIGSVWNPRGFFPVAIAALLAAIMYMVLVMPVLFREPLGSYIRPRLRFLPPQFQRIFPALAD